MSSRSSTVFATNLSNFFNLLLNWSSSVSRGRLLPVSSSSSPTFSNSAHSSAPITSKSSAPSSPSPSSTSVPVNILSTSRERLPSVAPLSSTDWSVASASDLVTDLRAVRAPSSSTTPFPLSCTMVSNNCAPIFSSSPSCTNLDASSFRAFTSFNRLRSCWSTSNAAVASASCSALRASASSNRPSSLRVKQIQRRSSSATSAMLTLTSAAFEHESR
mmetsp:Transcript_5250/g.14891  ORF Transcript_5250/g.14891 Transcript_5250/m.14891 type:complete len:217 (-) Transcript_5250:9-659(-)